MTKNVVDWLPMAAMQETFEDISSGWRTAKPSKWTTEFMFTVLLLNDQLTLTDRKLFCPETAARDFCITMDAIKEPTVAAFVVCNDDFEQNTIDSEPITLYEVEGLFRKWLENQMFGSLKWVALKRNMRPVKHRIVDMQKTGVWCDRMAALPERT